MTTTGRGYHVTARTRNGLVAVLCAAGLLIVAPAGAAELAQVPAAAPQSPSPATPAAQPAVSAPTRTLPTRNVRVSVVITDQAGTTAPVVKTVTMVIADGRRNQVRSVSRLRRQSSAPAGGPVMVTGELVPLQLNVDAAATVTPDKLVMVELRFNYGIAVRSSAEPSAPATVAADAGMAEISEELALLLRPGASVVAAESADATSDRKVKVEVRAEILP
jgi:hypothetical protein